MDIYSLGALKFMFRGFVPNLVEATITATLLLETPPTDEFFGLRILFDSAD